MLKRSRKEAYVAKTKTKAKAAEVGDDGLTDDERLMLKELRGRDNPEPVRARDSRPEPEPEEVEEVDKRAWKEARNFPDDTPIVREPRQEPAPPDPPREPTVAETRDKELRGRAILA